MTTRTMLMTACAVVGATLLLGTVSGCDDTASQKSLLVDPAAARLTDKMPTTLDDVPVATDTAVTVDSTEHFDAVCVEDGVPVDGALTPGTVVPCATMSFHETIPVYSKNYTGKHITTRVNYSNYDVGGGRIMRHVTIWPFESTYTWL